MEPTFTLQEADSAQVLTPAPSQYTFYVDTADKLVKYLGPDDVIRVMGPGIAASLETSDTPNPVIITGTVPVADQFLLAGSATIASWVYAPGFLKLGSEETSSFTLVARTIHPVNVNGGSTVGTMPLANSVAVDTEIMVKFSKEDGGNTFTINRSGSDTIDNFNAPITSIVLNADNEWVRFRSNGASIWYMFRNI